MYSLARETVDWLRRSGTKAVRDGMARYAIPSDKAFGVTVAALRKRAKLLGQSHELAAAFWASGWYEARMLAAFVDDPRRVTPAQMDRWCRAFDSWAICDTVCFHLFDRTPHAWRKVAQWADRRGEFEKRAAFALLWGLTVHDKGAADQAFLRCLPLVERAATDERNFVKKAVNMALRAMGKRNAALNTEAVAAARRLAASPDAAARWVGNGALRELTSAAVVRRLSAKRQATSKREATAMTKAKSASKAKEKRVAAPKTRTKARTIDDYLAALSPDQRAALAKLRKTIRAAAPKAEECISYQLAAFRQRGMLVAFGATPSHCAFYLMSTTTLENYKDELEGYETSKGTIRFRPEEPLPDALVRKLVKARIAENEGSA